MITVLMLTQMTWQVTAISILPPVSNEYIDLDMSMNGYHIVVTVLHAEKRQSDYKYYGGVIEIH